MTDELPPDTATDEGITMTRIFDAPREEVWKEWTEPERFADWFAPTRTFRWAPSRWTSGREGRGG
jgi:uncharacterized protein YndB with AHSA1/START domain